MRKMTFFAISCVMTAMCCCACMPSHARQKSNPVSADTSRPSLISVLRELNKSRDVFFLYAEDNMSQRPVNRVADASLPVEKILEAVLKGTGLDFKKVSGNTYVIVDINNRAAAGEWESHKKPTPFTATTKIYSGYVTGIDGKRLPGASLANKGAGTGALTNANGFFLIKAVMGDVYRISSIGYETREIRLGTDTALNISLELNEKQMREVIVTALGIKKESNSLGFAVSQLQGSEFTKAREINIGNALVGKIAGVNSSSPLTGPGGSSRVTIRGNSSLSFDNQPLYVLNGIPINNDNLGSAGKFGGADFGDGVNSINPDDVENITILKGGSAAALYGQRGRNGVIIINTKSGKGKHTIGVDWNSNVTVDMINDFTDFQQEYGQGFQGLKPVDKTSAQLSGLYAWGAKLDGSAVPVFDGMLRPYSPVSRKNLGRFYRTGLTVSNTIAISGASDAANFRVSFGDLRNQAVYPRARYIRDNINVDVNYRLSAKWSGQANISYSKETGRNRSNLSDAPGNGNFSILFLPPNVRADYLEPGYDAAGQETQFNDNAFNTNPYFAAAKFRNNTDRDRILGIVSMKYQPLWWFYVQTRVTNDFFSFNASSITPAGTAYKPGGTVNLERSYDYNELNADVLASAQRAIGENIGVTFTAGANLMQMRSRVLDVSADGLSFPFLYNPANASARLTNLTTPKKDVHSVYGSMELDWNKKVFITVTDRNDWSSTLPMNRNSYNYPSISASWILPTPPAKNQTPINFAKLRAGYAMVGGDAPVFATLMYYNTSGNINGNPIGNVGNEVPNNHLEPLKVTELEVGGEFRFFNDRVFTDVAWYDKRTLNDIVAATVSVGSGFSSALINVGKIRNRGMELQLGVVAIKNKQFNWTSSFNYAYNENKVIRLAKGQYSMQVPNGESRTERGFAQHIVGKSFSQVMVYDVHRDDKGNPVLGPNGLQPGNVLIPRGTGVHPVTGGWSNDLSYGRFSLSFLIDYKFGAVMYSGTNATAVQRGLDKSTLTGRETGIYLEGVDVTGNPVQKTVTAQNYYNELYRISAMHVYDADFVKFRSFTFTWAAPAGWLHKKISGLTLSLVGRNLFYVKKQTPNIDPEANYTNGNAQGLEYAALPSVRSYGLNINVRF